MVWVLVAVVIVLLVVVAVLVARQRRSQQLKEGFGPEYDRVLDERGDQRQAETELLERRERRAQFEVRELEPAARERYLESWRTTQHGFVDEPDAAVAQADRLVTDVMRDRGYPVEDDFERRAADVSVDHPVVVEHYRAAHAISRDSAEGRAGTEDLRRAMVHFRALFDDLLERGDRDGDDVDNRTRQPEEAT